MTVHPSQHAEPVERVTPQILLSSFEGINVCAPMVRYSKLPFRQLVSLYDCHITTTPMMLAKEFSRSQIARDADFSTNAAERGSFELVERWTGNPAPEWDDSPERRSGIHTKTQGKKRTRRVKGSMIVQFAANDPVHLADAAELVRPWVDGIDLNCGCPQKWAFQEGIGSALLRKPESVRDLVRATKQRLGWDFPVSVKIRVDADLSLTNTLVRTAIEAGADILTVHGRTRHQQSQSHPVNLDAIRFAIECARGQVPCVANGDVFTLEEANKSREVTGARGAMSARGLLANPALFAGFVETPLDAVTQFIQISTACGLIFPLFHRHVAYMLESQFKSRQERVFFNSLPSYAAVIDYLTDEMGLLLRPSVSKSVQEAVGPL
ncbi:tRNA dihydrouridine synthase [Microbotryomycetes sp. JL201]|nr:tRNA dihydrouridine synthase [Microbotryomycetes sp. JL201]